MAFISEATTATPAANSKIFIGDARDSYVFHQVWDYSNI